MGQRLNFEELFKHSLYQLSILSLANLRTQENYSSILSWHGQERLNFAYQLLCVCRGNMCGGVDMIHSQHEGKINFSDTQLTKRCE